MKLSIIGLNIGKNKKENFNLKKGLQLCNPFSFYFVKLN